VLLLALLFALALSPVRAFPAHAGQAMSNGDGLEYLALRADGPQLVSECDLPSPEPVELPAAAALHAQAHAPAAGPLRFAVAWRLPPGRSARSPTGPPAA